MWKNDFTVGVLWSCVFFSFKCLFIKSVWSVIFEINEISISNLVKFRFQRMTFKIEWVFEKINYILSLKQAKRAMNLVTKKDHNNCKISYMRKKFFFVRLCHYILLTTSVWYLKTMLPNFPMVWKWCPEILFLNLNLTVPPNRA